MKRLKRIEIKENMIIRNEQLLLLRGGEGECHCMCYTRGPIPRATGLMGAINQADCYDKCDEMGWTGTWSCTY